MSSFDDIPNTSVGPFRNRTGIRLVPGDGLTPNRLILEGERGAARLLLARESYGGEFDHIAKMPLYHLDEAILKPWPLTGDRITHFSRYAGLDITLDQEAVDRLEQQYSAVNASFSRWLPRYVEGEDMTWEFVPGSIDPARKEHVANGLRELGWDRFLFRFGFDAITEAATKRDALYALSMGMGKTRAALATAEYHRHNESLQGPTLILGMLRHLKSWFEEFEDPRKCTLLKATYGSHLYDDVRRSKTFPSLTRPFIVMSFERLRAMRKSDPQAVAELMAAMRGGTAIVDEVYVASRRGTQITESLFDIDAAHHCSLSGSPIRGYVSSVLPILQWTFRGGSLALPEYPMDRQGSQKRFDEKYVTYASTDGGRKRVPYIKNEEQFYAMTNRLICRRLRNEPEVIEEIGDLFAQHEQVEVHLDENHLATYNGILKYFREWYIRELQNRGDGKEPPAQDILAKLGYLVRGVSAPWRMADHSDSDFRWPVHDRKPTKLLGAVIDRATQETDEGQRSLIFFVNREPIDLVCEELNARGVRAAKIHGDVPAHQRDSIIDAFRRGNFDVLVASYGTLAEGINLACASRVLLAEYDWSPSTVRQAIARITRPDQTEMPLAVWFRCVGTIQDYQIRLAELKQEAMDSALDGVRQTSSGDDVPDIQAYAKSLILRNGKDEAYERQYFLEEVEI